MDGLLLLWLAWGSSPPTIREIAEAPWEFRGDTLTLLVRYVGWGTPGAPLYGVMLTRSDWIVEDSTGACYVRGVPSRSLRKGQEILLTAVVETVDSSFILVPLEVRPPD